MHVKKTAEHGESRYIWVHPQPRPPRPAVVRLFSLNFRGDTPVPKNARDECMAKVDCAV